MEILILSKNNTPIIRVPWQRAVRLLAAGTVELVGAASLSEATAVRYLPARAAMENLIPEPWQLSQRLEVELRCE